MGELLHVGALAPAAIGACCIAADRRRARAPELAASVLMLVAMLDAVLWGGVAGVVWAMVLVTAAIALAALRGRAARTRAGWMPASPGATAVPSAVMTVHATLGLVVMAALVLAMIPDAPVSVAVSVSVSGHHGSGASFGPVAAASAVVFGLASLIAARVPHGDAPRVSRLERAQLIAMGASTAAMGVALLA